MNRRVITLAMLIAVTAMACTKFSPGYWDGPDRSPLRPPQSDDSGTSEAESLRIAVVDFADLSGPRGRIRDLPWSGAGHTAEWAETLRGEVLQGPYRFDPRGRDEPEPPNTFVFSRAYIISRIIRDILDASDIVIHVELNPSDLSAYDIVLTGRYHTERARELIPWTAWLKAILSPLWLLSPIPHSGFESTSQMDFLAYDLQGRLLWQYNVRGRTKRLNGFGPFSAISVGQRPPSDRAHYMRPALQDFADFIYELPEEAVKELQERKRRARLAMLDPRLANAPETLSASERRLRDTQARTAFRTLEELADTERRLQRQYEELRQTITELLLARHEHRMESVHEQAAVVSDAIRAGTSAMAAGGASRLGSSAISRTLTDAAIDRAAGAPSRIEAAETEAEAAAVVQEQLDAIGDMILIDFGPVLGTDQVQSFDEARDFVIMRYRERVQAVFPGARFD